MDREQDPYHAVTLAKIDALASRLDLGLAHLQSTLETIARDLDRADARATALEARVRILEKEGAANQARIVAGAAIISAIVSIIIALIARGV